MNEIRYVSRVLEGKATGIDMDSFESGLRKALKGARYVSYDGKTAVDQDTQKSYPFELTQGIIDRIAGRYKVSSYNGVSGAYRRAKKGQPADLCIFMLEGTARAPQFFKKI